jgi:hypothetical protein
MRTLTVGVLVSLLLSTPGVAAAQAPSKLAVGTIRGDASRVRRQLLLQLCGSSYDCVAASRVATEGRPDPEKLQRLGVAGYLRGAVTGEPGDQRLALDLYTAASTARRPAHSWKLKLTPDGRLRPAALDKFSSELDVALAGAGPRAPAAPVAPPPRVQPQPPPPPPPPVAKPPPQEAPVEKPVVAAPPRETPSAAAQNPWVAVEGGLWITGRKLSYGGNASGLRTFDVSAIFVPRLRLEVYPAALAASPFVSGIGLYLDYGHSMGLVVKPPSGSTEGNHSASLSTVDVGVLWRLRPISGSHFVVAPALGYRSLQVLTSAKNGVKIDGLPDAKLSGYELRVDLEAPVSGRFAILGGGGYTMWTSAKDLVKGGYFGKGSAHGFQVDAGLSYAFFGPVSARALLDYQSTSYSSLGGSTTYTATSASDTYLGGRFLLRAEF